MVAVPSLGRATEVEAPPLPRESVAASDLYARYYGRIYRYCYGRLRSREEAEDAAQTTFLNAFRGLTRGVTPELEQAWLYKIAENVCLTRVRTNVRRLRVESPTDLEPLHDSVAAPVREGADLEAIQDALGRLPDQQRRAILMREWQGLTYAEIASELGISQSAVETLIFRARRGLAKRLREAEGGGRLRRLANAGSIVSWLKTLLVGGSTAAKVAAIVAAGSAVAVGGTELAPHHAHRVAAVGARSAARAVAPAPTSVPVLHRPAVVGTGGRNAKLQPMRLAPVRAANGAAQKDAIESPVSGSGRRERPEPVAAAKPAPGPSKPAEPKAAAPSPSPGSDVTPAGSAKPEDDAPAAEEKPTAPAPAKTHPQPPLPPAAAPKDKQPDDGSTTTSDGSGDEPQSGDE